MRILKKIKIAMSLISASILSSAACYIMSSCANNEEKTISRIVSIDLDIKELHLKIGSEQKISPIIKTEGTPDVSVTWETSDKNIATVDSDGVVKCVGGNMGNQCLITAITNSGGLTSSCVVTVDSIRVSGISLEKEIKLTKDEHKQLVPKITPENATDKTVVWSSENESIAKVYSDGIVEAVGNINEHCVVKAITNDGGFIATCDVFIIDSHQVRVTGIKLDPKNIELKNGEQRQLVPKITPENASNKNVKWTTENESIAKVSSDGIVEAIGKAGEKCFVEVETEDGGFKARCDITISQQGQKEISADDFYKINEEFVNKFISEQKIFEKVSLNDDNYIGSANDLIANDLEYASNHANKNLNYHNGEKYTSGSIQIYSNEFMFSICVDVCGVMNSTLKDFINGFISKYLESTSKKAVVKFYVKQNHEEISFRILNEDTGEIIFEQIINNFSYLKKMYCFNFDYVFPTIDIKGEFRNLLLDFDFK